MPTEPEGEESDMDHNILPPATALKILALSTTLSRVEKRRRNFCLPQQSASIVRLHRTAAQR